MLVLLRLVWKREPLHNLRDLWSILVDFDKLWDSKIDRHWWFSSSFFVFPELTTEKIREQTRERHWLCNVRRQSVLVSFMLFVRQQWVQFHFSAVMMLRMKKNLFKYLLRAEQKSLSYHFLIARRKQPHFSWHPLCRRNSKMSRELASRSFCWHRRSQTSPKILTEHEIASHSSN